MCMLHVRGTELGLLRVGCKTEWGQAYGLWPSPRGGFNFERHRES